MPSERSKPIRSIANTLGALSGRGGSSDRPDRPETDFEPALDVGTRLAAGLERFRRAELVQAARLLEPVPFRLDGLQWPPQAGHRFVPTGFEPGFALRAAVDSTRDSARLGAAPAQVPELSSPDGLDVAAGFDPVEFLGPPPQLPVFSFLPMRFRYHAGPMPSHMREPLVREKLQVEAFTVKPEPDAAGRLGGMLATMVTILKPKGKPCK